MSAFLHAIGTAVPGHDVHPIFIAWARQRLGGGREAALFDRMAARAGIAHRWSVLSEASDPTGPNGLYGADRWPGTAARMDIYAHAAPALALRAISDLGDKVSLQGITHLVVASCTGFVAPGIDQIIAARLNLPASTERVLIGFMGCYAAVAALRTARHIVRSDPAAHVLVVTVELSSLHLQETDDLEALLAMLQFGDGAAAALVSGEHGGIELGQPFATTLPDSADLIRWTVTDHGFAMHLSGEVPGRIAAALADANFALAITGGMPPSAVDAWAVHAGGRSILDAVGRSLNLPEDALSDSRAVLSDNGNMSSSTLMFVLARMLGRPIFGQGVALAFGPGLAAEGFRFASAA
ncbi:type III polyketide synthase [Sphingomonas sp. IC4-52]|uniref:type III polyketide synthase n=1 Tax=Sphingomonas sp. IC4-52 TaxID=2887202 RepID=UPI001D12B31D|nr:type III polyketide synthase [Sphingomonas sp. IC4-52]MCC2981580.1 type III polyketide synthase [Sphingomonas sp. IC4-52]